MHWDEDEEFDIRLTIIAYDLPEDVAYDDVEIYFECEKFSGGGEIEETFFKRPEKKALIIFRRPETVDRVLRQGRHEIEGKEIRVCRYAPVPAPAPAPTSSPSLRVTGFKIGTTAQTIEMYFSNPRKANGGEIASVVAGEDDSFIVKFVEEEVCQRVLAQDKHVLTGCTLRVQPYFGRLPAPSRPPAVPVTPVYPAQGHPKVRATRLDSPPQVKWSTMPGSREKEWRSDDILVGPDVMAHRSKSPRPSSSSSESSSTSRSSSSRDQRHASGARPKERQNLKRPCAKIVRVSTIHVMYLDKNREWVKQIRNKLPDVEFAKADEGIEVSAITERDLDRAVNLLKDELVYLGSMTEDYDLDDHFIDEDILPTMEEVHPTVVIYYDKALDKILICGVDASTVVEALPSYLEPKTSGEKECRSRDQRSYKHSSSDTFIHVLKYDITKLHVDAIVNSVNGSLKLASGVGGAISKAAGPSVAAECAEHYRTYGRQSVGSVFVSGAGNLPCRAIMHAVSPATLQRKYGKAPWRDIETLLYNCFAEADKKDPWRDIDTLLYNCFAEADRKGMKSIAFPPIGAGNLGAPGNAVARLFADEISRYFTNHKYSTIKHVYIVDIAHSLIKEIQEQLSSGHSLIEIPFVSDGPGLVPVTASAGSSPLYQAPFSSQATGNIKTNFVAYCCTYKALCAVFFKTLDLHEGYFDEQFDMCYCQKCHTQRDDKDYYTRGDPPKLYGLPIGWYRFGLHLPPRAKDPALDVSNKWHRAFHGTRHESLVNILKVGELVPAGRDVLGGGRVREAPGHYHDGWKPEGFNTKQIFLSPSILYSGVDAYAKPTRWSHKSKTYETRVAFQVLICPNSYRVGRETIGAKTQLDPKFPNSEIEWFTTQQGSTMLYGLLVKVEEK